MATDERVAEALRRLEEPPFGHHIKGNPREGEWWCTCGYGQDPDNWEEWDTAEEHIAKVAIGHREKR